MLDYGTKVKILASTAKNTASPRKGSIGYIIDNSNGYYIFYNKNLKFMVSLYKVLFTRYGFENKKTRREIKHVINIFPIIKDKMTISSSKSYIQEVIKKLGNSKTNNKRWKEIRTEFFPTIKAAAFVIACPEDCNPIRLDTCDLSEFRAWVDSHILSISMRMMLFSMTRAANKKFITCQISTNYINLLSKQSEKKYSTEYIFKEISKFSGITDEKQIRMDLVRIINLMKTIECTKECIKHITQFRKVVLGSHMMAPNGQIASTSIYRHFGQYLFDKYLNIKKIKVIGDIKNRNRTEAVKLLHNMTTVQEALNTFN